MKDCCRERGQIQHGSAEVRTANTLTAPPFVTAASSAEHRALNTFAPRPFLVAAVALAALAGGLVLYFFDPNTAGFYPLCPVHELTGLQCPGCGCLRALHQLAHGNLAAAWRLNAFLVAMLPVAFWLGLREAVLWTTGRQWPGIVTRPIFGWALVAGLVVFGVLRNVPQFWR
jgi:hypothetical protein